jgi:hypothetical protein
VWFKQKNAYSASAEALSSNPSPTKKNKKVLYARYQWFIPVILATWETENKRIKV